MSLLSLLDSHGKTRPNHPAIEDGDRVVPYAELRKRSQQVAAALWEAGIRPGDVVALCLDDSADHLIVLCGLVRLGAVFWPLDTDISQKGLNAALVEFDAVAIFTSSTRSITPEVMHFTVAEILASNPSSVDLPIPTDDRPLALIQSSGTTGKPKYVFWSRQQLLANLDAPNPADYWRQSGRCLCLIHMCFNSALRYNLRFLLAGATVVINTTASLEEMALLVNEKQISYLVMIPAQVHALMKFAKDKLRLFPNLHVVATISGAMPSRQVLRAQEALASVLHIYYGTNESGLVAISTAEDHYAFPGSLGRLVEGFDAQVVDRNDRVLPTGSIGLLRLKGPHLPTAYVNDPGATRRQFRDGWFYPGDLASFDETGRLFFKGRIDDVISKSGVKFYPVEVEQVLLSFPGVAEAAVFAWPHSTYGEVAAACIVTEPNLNLDSLRAFCTRHLATYKRPQHMVVVDAMPKNAMGKIVKTALKERLLANLNAIRKARDP